MFPIFGFSVPGLLGNRNFFFTVPVPVPTFEKLWFRFRFRLLTSYSSGSGSSSISFIKFIVKCEWKQILNEGNQIHNFKSSSGFGTVINYDSSSDILTSYGSGPLVKKLRFRFRFHNTSLNKDLVPYLKCWGTLGNWTSFLFDFHGEKMLYTGSYKRLDLSSSVCLYDLFAFQAARAGPVSWYLQE